MFKCENCGKTSKPGESQITVVKEKREKTYWKRYCPECNEYSTNNEDVKFCPLCAVYGEEVSLEVAENGRGWEIVREEKQCAECANKWEPSYDM